MRPGFPEHVAPSPTSLVVVHNSGSAWRTPVPYLFGGLAAMMGLIAFSLLILACSYWRISGFVDADTNSDTTATTNTTSGGGGGGGGGDTDSTGKPVGHKPSTSPCLEEELGFVVIMAGHNKPTFLATPRPPPPPPFGSLLDSTTTAGKLTAEEEGKATAAEGITNQYQHQL